MGRSAKPRAINGMISKLRADHRNDTNDMYKALALADALLERDRMHHNGGTQIVEAFDYGEFL